MRSASQHLLYTVYIAMILTPCSISNYGYPGCQSAALYRTSNGWMACPSGILGQPCGAFDEQVGRGIHERSMQGSGLLSGRVAAPITEDRDCSQFWSLPIDWLAGRSGDCAATGSVPAESPPPAPASVPVALAVLIRPSPLPALPGAAIDCQKVARRTRLQS